MPNMNVPFGGNQLIVPNAYYQDNVQAAYPVSLPNTPPLILVGYGAGPQPFVPQFFSSLQDLQQAVRSGPVSQFIPFLSTPSPALNGAQVVTFIDVSANTPSTFSFLNSAATAVITATSAQYGLPSNLLQVSVAAGTIASGVSRKITLYDGYSGVQAVQDNLGVPLTIAYTGTSTAVTATITVVSGLATVLTVNSPNVGESFTIPLDPSGYATIGQVAEYLNGTGFYQSAATSNIDLPSQQMAAAAAVALPAPVATVPQVVKFTSTINDILWWLNNHTNGLISSAVGVGSPPNTTGSTPNIIPLTHFSGATNVPPTTGSYASGFNVAQTVPGFAVFADAGTPAVQQLGAQHALLMSEPFYGKWRRFFTGSSLGDSTATSIANAAACGAYQAAYVHGGVSRVSNATNVVTTFPGLYVAAGAAAMACGNPAVTPFTHKPLVADGPEQNLTISQIDQLQQGGCIPVGVTDNSGTVRLISDATTWLADANPENVFNQQVACRQYLAYTMVNALQPFVGTVASTLDEINILNAAKAALNLSVNGTGNPNGVINSWDSSSLTLVYTGANQLAAITVNVTLVGQNRFITCTTNVEALNITLSASA